MPASFNKFLYLLCPLYGVMHTVMKDEMLLLHGKGIITVLI